MSWVMSTPFMLWSLEGHDTHLYFTLLQSDHFWVLALSWQCHIIMLCCKCFSFAAETIFNSYVKVTRKSLAGLSGRDSMLLKCRRTLTLILQNWQIFWTCLYSGYIHCTVSYYILSLCYYLILLLP